MIRSYEVYVLVCFGLKQDIYGNDMFLVILGSHKCIYLFLAGCSIFTNRDPATGLWIFMYKWWITIKGMDCHQLEQ